MLETFTTPGNTFTPDQISFNKSRQQYVNLPQYSTATSKNLCLIYDRFYFDINNGNLVELVSHANAVCKGGIDGCTLPDDTTGKTIIGIVVYPRDADNFIAYKTDVDSAGAPLPRNTAESQRLIMVDSNKQLIFFPYDTQYQLLYIGYGKNTYIHVMISYYGLLGNVGTFMFSPSSVNGTGQNMMQFIKYDNPQYGIPTTSLLTQNIGPYTQQNEFVTINNNIKFDLKTQSLLLQPKNLSLNANVNYNKRMNNTVIDNDADGNMVLAIGFDTDIVICIFTKGPDVEHPDNVFIVPNNNCIVKLKYDSFYGSYVTASPLETPANTNNTTAGLTNTAAGSYNTAAGSYNTAADSTNTAAGLTNTAGSYNTAAGSYNTAAGLTNTAAGLTNTTAGLTNTAAGLTNTAAGSYNTTAGSYNTAAGLTNTAAGSYNTAAGLTNTAAGLTNTAAGSTNTAAGLTNTAAGSYNTTAGSYNTTAGLTNTTAGLINTTAGSYNTTAGLYNTVGFTPPLTTFAQSTTSGLPTTVGQTTPPYDLSITVGQTTPPYDLSITVGQTTPPYDLPTTVGQTTPPYDLPTTVGQTTPPYDLPTQFDTPFDCGDAESCEWFYNHYRNHYMDSNNDYIRKTEILPGITDSYRYHSKNLEMQKKNASQDTSGNMADYAKLMQEREDLINALKNGKINEVIPTPTSMLTPNIVDRSDDLKDKIKDKMNNWMNRIDTENRIAGTPRPGKSEGQPVAYGPGSDMYSYFGALPAKGESNFVAVNSDFSAFRR